jgi:hypothetical protein
MIEVRYAATVRFTADGAYDTWAIYEALGAAVMNKPTVAIPPRRMASTSQPTEAIFEQRDAVIARIEEMGRRQ